VPTPAPVGTPQQPYEDPAVVAKRNAGKKHKIRQDNTTQHIPMFSSLSNHFVVVRSATERIQGRLHEFNVSCTREVDEEILKSQQEEEKARVRALTKSNNNKSQTKTFLLIVSSNV
jgi:hypothetical protein